MTTSAGIIAFQTKDFVKKKIPTQITDFIIQGSTESGLEAFFDATRKPMCP